jgi:hypothetical protein
LRYHTGRGNMKYHGSRAESQIAANEQRMTEKPDRPPHVHLGNEATLDSLTTLQYYIYTLTEQVLSQT